MTKHLFTYYNEIFPKMWDKDALTDYNGTTNYTFAQLAAQIERLHILFEQLGIKSGDKIAICGRNCSNWAVAYLAIASYGGVIVSILHDFNSEDIVGLLKHSDSKMLFVGPYIWKSLESKINEAQNDTEQQTMLNAIVSIADFTVLYDKTQSGVGSLADIETFYSQRFPEGVQKTDVHYRDDNYDDLMLINYTSGSMGAPKGVMLSYRSLSGNLYSGHRYLPNKPGQRLVSMLPLAHMFGQLAEFLFPLSGGCHIYFLVQTPTPSLLMRAFAEVKPYMIVTVPLIIEKICKRQVFPITNKAFFQKLWNAPLGIGAFIRNKVKNKILKAFGGRLKYFIVGGAGINEDVERLLLDIHFPLCVGYGMTECGPLIGGSTLQEFVARSSGHILPGNEIRIDSADPYNEVGEILIRGEHVMMGYYKNEKATKEAFTEDGFLRTGDLGIIDQQNNIFIKGRCKNMILGASGQNIYPEDIENKLNDMEGVAESIVVERKGKLVALVFPDMKGELTFSQSISELMRENLERLNRLLPKYSQVTSIELQDKEFEKTPKKSIKRFLYK